MPVIPQYYRQQRLSGTAGNVITNVSTDNRQLAELGNTLTEIGMRSEQQRLQAQYHDQLNNAKLQAAKMFDEYNDNLDINDTSKYLENLEKVQAQYDGIKFTNGNAQSDFGQYLETLKYNQKKVIADKRRMVDAKLFEDHFNSNVNTTKNLAAKAETEGEFNLVAQDTLNSLYGVDFKDGTLQLIEGWSNPLFNSDEQRLSTAKAWLDSANIQRTKEQGFKMAMQLPYLEGEKLIKSLNLPTDEKKKLLSDYKFETEVEAQSKAEQAAIKQRENIGIFTDTIAKGEFINPITLENSDLSNLEAPKPTFAGKTKIFDSESTTYIGIWKEIADGQGKSPATSTNSKRYNQLSDMIFKYYDKEYGYDIEDMQTLLTHEYMAKKSISPAGYQELLSRLEVNIPQETMGSYKKVYDTGKSLIKDKDTFSNFSKDLFSFIKNNPNASYNNIQEILTPYKNERAKRFLGEFLNKPGGGPVFRNPAYTPETKQTNNIVITTDEEYDKLSSGTEFTDSNGKRWRKP
jgi:hypothetical protein